MNAGCTIVSPNYLHYARTLSESYRQHHPDHLFFVLVVAKVTDSSLFEGEPFTAVLLNEIGLENIPALAMKYDILELNTNVKPTFLKHLLDKHRQLDHVVYLDPDIFVYAPLNPIFTLLLDNNIVITPHTVIPQIHGSLEREQGTLLCGTYNLGFIGLKRGAESAMFLDWWERRCLQLAYSELQSGLFVDQKWINLVPGLFDGVAICRHLGCNMAYWNLQERTLAPHENSYMVNGKYLLIFYHFSGIVIDAPNSLTKYTEEYTFETRRDLREIFYSYREAVTNNRREATDNIPYGFDHFNNGVKVRSLTRRIFSAHEARFPLDNPFSESSSFYQFAKKKRLIGGREFAGQKIWRTANQNSTSIRILNFTFRIALFVLGPAYYEMLMRYISHFSNLRAQKVFLK